MDTPRSGNGRLVGGIFAIGLGVPTLAIVYSGANKKDGDNDPPAITNTFAALGFVSLAAGTFLVIRGARVRAEFDAWRARAPFDMREDGSGLIVGGAMATVFGSATLIAAGVAARDPDVFTTNLVPALLGISTIGVVAGAGFLSWGLVRRHRYVGWRNSTFISNGLPTVVPLHRGAGLGFVGRF